MDILTLAQGRTQLKKISSTHGGEWVGPCPACGGRDRFHVWPDKHDSTRSERVGIYWCRSCGKAGDVVKWFVDFEGMSFAAAFRALGEEMPQNYKNKYAAPKIPGAGACMSKNNVQDPGGDHASIDQPEIWLKKAAALVEHAEKALMDNAYILGWLKKRGITKKTAAGMRLGWLSEDRFRARSIWGLPEITKEDGKLKKLWLPAGLVIPMISGDGAVRRIRIRRFTENEPRYYVVPGSAMACMAHGLPNRAAVIVEAELDAIMVAARIGDLAGVVAMGSAKTRPGAAAMGVLRSCAVILVALDHGDNDLAGAKGWTWWKESFPQAKRWPVPSGKDPGEAFAAGVDIAEWVNAGLPRGWQIGPSSIGLVSGRAAECSIAEVETSAPAIETITDAIMARNCGYDTCMSAPPEPSGSIEELGRLLAKNPVEVRIAADGSRVWIRESEAWKRKNWDTSKRISELVFRDCAVLEYLLGHEDGIINGRNFVKTQK